MLREKSLNLEPGRQHFVDLSGIRVSTDSSAAKLDVDYRFFLSKIIINKMELLQSQAPVEGESSGNSAVRKLDIGV